MDESEVKALDETVGINGTERVNYLKDQFRNIIDNVLSFESKLSLILFDQIPLSKLIRLLSGSKNKFMKRKSTGNEALDMILSTEVSEEMIDFLKLRGKTYIK